jgi:hypothetical protein
MDEKRVRLLIRKMLQSGRLPYEGASNVSGSPAAGEVCAACGATVADVQLVMEGMTNNGNGAHPIQFHVLCFQLWNDERRKPREQIA